jgi:hypothetical protein
MSKQPRWLDAPEQARWVDAFGVWGLGDGAPRRLHPVPAEADRVIGEAIYSGTTRTALRDGGEQSFVLPPCVASVKRNALVAVADDGVMLRFCGDKIQVVEAGAVLTTLPVRGTLVGEQFTTVAGKPVVVLGETERGVTAFDRSSGQQLWTSDVARTTSGFAAASFAPQVVVMHYEHGDESPHRTQGVFGFDAATGRRLWHLALPAPQPPELQQYVGLSPSLVRVWWLDEKTFMLVTPASEVGPNNTAVVTIQAQRYRLVDGKPVAANPPVLVAENCISTYTCPSAATRDGRIFTLRAGRYVELSETGALLSEFVTGPSGSVRRFADGRQVCEGDCCGMESSAAVPAR